MKGPQVCFTSLKTNNNNNRIHRLDLDQLINILNLYLPFPDINILNSFDMLMVVYM